MLIINNHEIIANGTPKDLYKNPKNKYCASLFDDVNEIEIDGRQGLLYPHQIRITEKSLIKADVTNTYFKGKKYSLYCCNT